MLMTLDENWVRERDKEIENGGDEFLDDEHRQIEGSA